MTSGDRLTVVRGDVTGLAVDAVVNAANEHLAPGGGVCGAIHAAAGPELARACAALAPCAPGDARLTPGFALSARHVIHAVGPRWRGGGHGEAETLASCYRRSLELAAAAGLESVAFPAIGTGVFGYPLEEACSVAVAAVRGHLARHERPVRVLLCAFDERTEVALREALAAGPGRSG